MPSGTWRIYLQPSTFSAFSNGCDGEYSCCLIRLPERKCPFLVGPSMSAKTSARTPDPTAMGRNFPGSVSETKAAEKRRTPQSAKAQDFFGLRRFFRRFGFSQGDPYRPGLRPADPTRSGWEGTSWDPYKNTVFRKCSLKQFPYAVYYLELDHCVWIAAVAHQKRKPGYWSQRRPP